MTPVWPHPRVMFASPSGCPSFAKAAPLTKTGMRLLKPSMLVEGSHCDMGRSTRGWKKIRLNALMFSAWAGEYNYLTDFEVSSLQNYKLTYFIITSGRVICPGFEGNDFPCNILQRKLEVFRTSIHCQLTSISFTFNIRLRGGFSF